VNYIYKAFGLIIQSKFPLPELASGNGTPDVFIMMGTVPENLDGIYHSGLRFQASPEAFLLNVENVGRYLVKNGKTIIVEKQGESSIGDIRLFLLGSAFAALIHQRKFLPLHGSAVKVENHCVIFCGGSGAGKSTLAAGLMKKGFSLLADDACVISFTESNIPMVYPGYPQIKLWKDSLKKLGTDISELKKLRESLEKFGLPVKNNFFNESLPLKQIYILNTTNNLGFEIKQVKGFDKFKTLKNHTYRVNFVKGLQTMQTHFQLVNKLASLVEVKRLYRTNTNFSIDNLVDFVIEDIIKNV
jgi:hypothetical protein